jgi:predicted DNA-binding transcriptional regulator AlpA
MVRYIRYAELAPRYGITFSRTHLRRLMRTGLFPKPVELAPNSIAWREDEILAYGERIRAERDAGVIRRHRRRRTAG